MYAYGIRGTALKLLKNYLTDRTQYVIYDGMQSTTLPISCGVPQGWILGPILFIITMNDIGKDLIILTIDTLVVHRIGIAMYKINNGLFPSVLNELYKKNNVIHDHYKHSGCS